MKNFIINILAQIGTFPVSVYLSGCVTYQLPRNEWFFGSSRAGIFCPAFYIFVSIVLLTQFLFARFIFKK